MKTYKMVIELLSDLCVSDGSTYHSMVDTEICTDRLGFPFIPAKRLKGCLRECAEELCDWGIKIPIERMFGREGNQAGTIRIGNAYLEHEGEYRQEIQNYEGIILGHPQNILNEFSYLRTQTAIDYETGVAMEQSLRVMRVVNKGLRFISNVTISEQDLFFLQQCCRILKHMGLARTRGLGEISVTIGEREQQKEYINVCEWKDHATLLEYEVTLLEPMLCKAIGGGEERTMDYIDGAKMLGVIAQASKKDGENAFLDFMEEGEFICSNAYLEANGCRLTPVPACYYKIKNQTETFIDKTSLTYNRNQDSRQLQSMRDCYVTEDTEGNLLCRTVQMEEHYHHRRPLDKSIGHATGNGMDGSVFYQISSISEGQKFRGFMQGSEGQIKKAYQYLKEQSQIFMGAGRNSEYGMVNLSVTKLLCSQANEEEYTKAFLVKLESPLILYGENAAYTTDVEKLKQEFHAVLKLDESIIEQIDCYIDTTTVGGYQVTWGMKKPVIGAFDMGSVFVYHLKEAVNISNLKKIWVGERVNEGYGEVSVRNIENKREERRILSQEISSRQEKMDITHANLLSRICSRLFTDYVMAQAVCMADENVEKWKRLESVKPTVSNMIQMCKGLSTFPSLEKECERRFREKENEKKWIVSREILRDCKAASKDLLNRFLDQYQIDGYFCPADEVKWLYLQGYLQEIRYLLRDI